MNEEVLSVWIVDDEAAMCHAVSRTLDGHAVSFADLEESIRFSVKSMESGEAFFERLKKDAPHILLLDGKLPGMHGMDVLRRLAEQKLPIVAIMITAYATFEAAVQATKLGTFDFLAKPFTPAELRYAVTKAARDIMLTRRARLLERQKREMRFEFISVLAHELKAPIGAIEGYLDLMKIRASGPALDSYDNMLKRMEVRAFAMRKLIADLLDLTYLESGKKKRDFELVDIREMARRAVENNAAEAAAAGIACAVNAAGPCVYRAVRGEMEMLVGNLITNAIKYNVPGGRVAVDLRDDGGSLVIRVEDTGIGIKPEDQTRLFREFSRIKTARTRHIDGSGLGLSIIKKICTLYGATVSLQSAENKGSVFTVTLPHDK